MKYQISYKAQFESALYALLPQFRVLAFKFPFGCFSRFTFKFVLNSLLAVFPVLLLNSLLPKFPVLLLNSLFCFWARWVVFDLARAAHLARRSGTSAV